jgi:hypothetical protein
VRGKSKFAGGRPAAGFFLLLAQKKETKEKGTLLRRRNTVPCATQSNRALRNSRFALRQCSLESSRFDFVAWRLRRELKIANTESGSINNYHCHLEHNIKDIQQGGTRLWLTLLKS